MNIHLSGLYLLLCSIIVLYFGNFVTRKVSLLKEYNIPAPVTGGLLSAMILALLMHFKVVQVTFDLQIRDFFLLVFFSSVGLSSRFSELVNGGKALITLFVILFCFIALQNFIGIGSSLLLGLPPINGLLAGSVAFAGGHGTAITWGQYFSANGYGGSEDFGLIAATFGLILGGLLGGPISHMLIKRHALVKKQKHLFAKHAEPTDVVKTPSQAKNITFSATCLIRILLELSITIAVGTTVNQWLKAKGLVIPDIFMVLIVGIIIANIADFLNIRANEGVINIFGEISLDIFVAMALFSLKLSNLTETALPLVAISIIQSLFIGFFAYHIFFRFAGKDYDAAVMTSGFIGAGLGATPVGMANVEAVTHRFGASPKALLLIPLMGSFFTDIINAIILRSMLELPIFS